jgi:hypothetical protein
MLSVERRDSRVGVGRSYVRKAVLVHNAVGLLTAQSLQTAQAENGSSAGKLQLTGEPLICAHKHIVHATFTS